MKSLDWYGICENACVLYDEDVEEVNCKECPLMQAFTKLAAYEDAEERGQLRWLRDLREPKTVFIIHRGEIIECDFRERYSGGNIIHSYHAKDGSFGSNQPYPHPEYDTRETAEAALKSHA